MILRTVQRELRRASNDDAVSPVVGTILMVAITVLMGATVYTAVNGFGEESTSPPPNMVFRLQRVDAERNGQFEAFKLTYLTGPANFSNEALDISVTPDPQDTPSGSRANVDDPWFPGDFVVYDPAFTSPNVPPATFFVTVSALGVTIVDESVVIDE